jgi:hypothetical protein
MTTTVPQPPEPEMHTHRNHPHTRTVAAVVTCTAMTALLTAVPTTPMASAAPTATNPGYEEPFSRQCFTEPSRWNTALDGPIPRCPGPIEDASESDTVKAGRSDLGYSAAGKKRRWPVEAHIY